MESDIHQLISRALVARQNGEYAPIVLPGADLAGVRFEGADLSDARLSRVSFTLASLAGANLSRADLSDASLHGSDLAGADLTEANLRGADLTKANLDDAVLVNADLRGCLLRGFWGQPLSMSGALLNDETVRRSALSEAEIAQLLDRGAVFETPDSVPPSIRRAQSSRGPSIVPMMRQREIETRHMQVEEDLRSIPPSKRAFDLLTHLIEDARGDEMPMSLRSAALPQVSVKELSDADAPAVGHHFLGYSVDEELHDSTVARTFVGRSAEGDKVFIKYFDPYRYGAALNLPAFQRGLRAMNRVLGAEGGAEHMVQILANASDLTAYVCRYYEDGAVDGLTEVNLTLEAGLDLFEQVCKSVAFVHKSSCLVRSLKPSNVLLEGLRPILAEIDMIDLPTVAQSSPSVAGYGSFAAPEELARMGTRSPTADVFAVGKLLEFLLTGRDPIAPLMGPSVLEQREDVPKFLVNLVKRCTKPDATDRFQYIEEILDEITRFREQGVAAQLRQAMRVRSVSRIPAPPTPTLDLPQLDARPRKLDAFEAPPESFRELPSRWLSRPQEVGAAILGFLVVSGALGLIAAAPNNVDSIENMWFGVAAVGGLWTWVLPRFRQYVVPTRFAMWLTGAWLLFWLSPLPIAQFSWKRALDGGDRIHRERAVFNLIRTGSRDFSGKDLSRLDFKKQDLSLANFANANLRGTDMSNAFLRDSNFAGANFDETLLYGADLRATHLDSAKSLKTARCDRFTELPPAWLCIDGTIQSAAETAKPDPESKRELETTEGAGQQANQAPVDQTASVSDKPADAAPKGAAPAENTPKN